MSNPLSSKTRIAFIGSLALNVFLLAFVLGRLSMAPPPPPHHELGFHGPHGDMPPPPPFFSPSGLFTPDEMKADAAANKATFDKMRDLRKSFGQQLQKGNVTKEQVLNHFAEIDKIMDDMRHSTQQRVADKITSMSVEERANFGEKLMQDPPEQHFSSHNRAPGAPPSPPPGEEPGMPSAGDHGPTADVSITDMPPEAQQEAPPPPQDQR